MPFFPSKVQFASPPVCNSVYQGLVVVVVVVVVYLHDNSNIIDSELNNSEKIMQTRSSKKLETYKQRTLITV